MLRWRSCVPLAGERQWCTCVRTHARYADTANVTLTESAFLILQVELGSLDESMSKLHWISTDSYEHVLNIYRSPFWHLIFSMYSRNAIKSLTLSCRQPLVLAHWDLYLIKLDSAAFSELTTSCQLQRCYFKEYLICYWLNISWKKFPLDVRTSLGY